MDRNGYGDPAGHKEHASEGSSPPPGREQFFALCAELARQCNLPPFPKVASRAMRLTAEPGVTAQEVVRVVSADPALAARVLNIARSPVYLRREAPRTLLDAVITVGFDTVRQILIAAAARMMHPARDAVAERLWAHALATALAADELRPAGEARGADTFVAGLLHDVGLLVFYATDPAAFVRLRSGDTQLEKDVYGLPHAVVGGYLVESWNIDTAIANAIWEHHVRPACGLAARVALADWIAYQLGHAPLPGPMPRPETVELLRQDLEDVTARARKAFAAEQRFFA
jgi:HD-like signal output (HDOD) protein